MITSKNPASVPVPCKGSAWFHTDACCKTEAGDLIMKKYGMSKDTEEGIGDLRMGGKKTRQEKRIYKRWIGAKQRCYDKNKSTYKHYGGRGICVCEEWLYDFKVFYDYVMSLSNALKEGYTIDRIDNDGNYEPGNLRWASQHTQIVNRGIQSNNTSGYRGVTFCKTNLKWKAYIQINGDARYICKANSAREAAIARDEYLIKNGLTEYELAIIKYP